MMKVIASALVVLFVLNRDPLQSQQTHSVFSQAFLKEAITAIDVIDAAYKSVLNRDPDAVYAPLWDKVQKSLVSLKTEASARREKELLRLLYAVSNVIGMMRPSDNQNTDEFRLEAGIAVQCSTEAKLKVEHDSVVVKLPKDFRSGQCLAAMDALVRSIQ
jgi:hypothetical protein